VKYGALLETCDAGTLCREEIEKSMKESMKKTWKNIVDTFKETVTTTVAETRTLVDTNWKSLIQCETSHPCCRYTETEWINTTI